MSDEESSLDPGRIGDVCVSGQIIGAEAGPIMMKDVEPIPESEAPVIKERLRHSRRRKDGKGGRWVKKPGRAPRGLLRAGERSRGKWDFRRVTGLIPLSRAGLLRAAAYRDELEREVRRLYAGSPAGLYVWKVLQSALRHEMRAMMMEQLLEERGEELTIEQTLLVIKHLCDASDNSDEALKRAGLDKLCQTPDQIDPWTAPLPEPEVGKQEVLSPPEPSAKEIVGEYVPKGDGGTIHE